MGGAEKHATLGAWLGENRGITYGRLCVPQQSPVNFGEPFGLLDLARAALAAQPGVLLFVQQPHDDVLSGPVWCTRL